MGLTDAMLTVDVNFIQSDLDDTSATESVGRAPAGEDDAGTLHPVDTTFDIVRAKQMTREELIPSGLMKASRFSFYAQTVDNGASTQGDIIVMANGDRLRIYKLTPQPAKLVTMFDVGDEFESGEDYEV